MTSTGASMISNTVRRLVVGGGVDWVEFALHYESAAEPEVTVLEMTPTILRAQP